MSGNISSSCSEGFSETDGAAVRQELEQVNSQGEVCLHFNTLNHPPLLLNIVGFSLKVNMLKTFKATTCSISHGMENVIA
ncbi:hypothetical protein KOW79_013143 [Hemibagrus wyckioides]|uniref:Uncharacterized protein n=1 Tax=Hemibagrus wyckioides TaxID=337641 RepID=A0A9D3NH77_9TELE|nr:hypothetical protein KOW79_013143 [Hemibagrus wyckioides]